MKNVPAIWLGLLLLALLTVLSFWIDRAVQAPAPKRDGSTRHDPDYIVHNFSATRSDLNGNPRYDMAGDEMRHYPDDDSTDLVRPNYVIYSATKPATRVLSERGRISSNGENVYFMDNVKVVRAATADKGEMSVLTSYLHVIPDQGIAQTDRAVTILQAPRTVVTANSMFYDKKQGILNLRDKVRVHYVRPAATGGKALSIEQIAGNRQFLDHGLSSVKPASKIFPQLPVQEPQQKIETPAPSPANNRLNKQPETRAETAKSVKKQVKNKPANKKTINKPSPKKTTPSKTSKTQVRRHYEKP